jgi:hypothetical protein
MYVLKHHTHWGKYLQKMVLSQNPHIKGWAKTLLKRLRDFLDGKADPLWLKKGHPRLPNGFD